jgi:hypothetical protein
LEPAPLVSNNVTDPVTLVNSLISVTFDATQPGTRGPMPPQATIPIARSKLFPPRPGARDVFRPVMLASLFASD